MTPALKELAVVGSGLAHWWLWASAEGGKLWPSSQSQPTTCVWVPRSLKTYIFNSIEMKQHWMLNLYHLFIYLFIFYICGPNGALIWSFW
jgi:hypothetical protein